MNISKNLTQQRFQEILLHTYLKGQNTEDIKVNELIEEIKELLLLQTEAEAILNETVV